MKKLTRLAGVTALALAPLALAGLGLTAEAAMATAQPVITSVSPGTGPAAGGNTVTINGSDLNDLGTPVIHFGATAATVLTQTANVVTVTVPAGHGLVAIRVTDGAAGTSVADGASQYLYSFATVPIRNYRSGLCLSAGAGLNGTRVVQQACNGSAAQRWTFETNGQIRAWTGRCMDAAGYGIRNGTPIQTWACLGNSNQSWRPVHESVPAGTFAIRGKGSGKVLDAIGHGLLGAGSRAQLWTWLATDNQLWVL